ncbi:MAG: AraC family transcriptional regulator [Rhizobiaceae bacterium]|nr:AraC family transcriptional regulator [Rhizobiaceae bacterium]
MTKNKVWANYEKRLARVSDYIYANLDDDLDMVRLAEIACLSPYHWHRIYHAVYGETIAATVKRLRLHRAAGDLTHSQMPVLQIAKRAGYPNLQSFNHTFKGAYGIAPGRFRTNAALTADIGKVSDIHNDSFDISIENINQFTLVGFEHTGPYMEIGKAFEKMFRHLYAAGHNIAEPVNVAIYHDDPALTPQDQLTAYAGVIIDDNQPISETMTQYQLAGGEYAVLGVSGPYSNLGQYYEWFYNVWLKNSGREVRDAPGFDKYLNSPRDTPPAQLLTKIYLPLK